MVTSFQTSTFRSDNYIPFRKPNSIQPLIFPSDSYIPFRQKHSVQRVTFRSGSYIPFRQLHSFHTVTFHSESYISFSNILFTELRYKFLENLCTHDLSKQQHSPLAVTVTPAAIIGKILGFYFVSLVNVWREPSEFA